MEDAIEGGDRKAVKEGFKLILSGGHHICSAVRQRKVESEHDWTERPLCNTQVFRRDGEVIWEA